MSVHTDVVPQHVVLGERLLQILNSLSSHHFADPGVLFEEVIVILFLLGVDFVGLVYLDLICQLLFGELELLGLHDELLFESFKFFL